MAVPDNSTEDAMERMAADVAAAMSIAQNALTKATMAGTKAMEALCKATNYAMGSTAGER